MSKTALLLGKSPIFKPVMWFQIYDNTNLRVNVDGTGGLPTDGGPAGLVKDISGFGQDANGQLAGARPVWRTNFGVNFWNDSDAPGGVGTGFYKATIQSATGGNLNSMNFSGGMYIDLHGANSCPLFDLADGVTRCALRVSGGGFSIFQFSGGFLELVTAGSNYGEIGSPHYFPKGCVVTWRSTASQFVVRCNGVEAFANPNVSGASTTCNLINFATFNGGNPAPYRLYEALIFDHDIGEGTMLSLESYLLSKAAADMQNKGLTPDPTKVVITIGDSLSGGIGSSIYKPIYDFHYISNRPNSTWYQFNCPGAALFSPIFPVSSAVTYKTSVENIASVYMGTNDISSFGRPLGEVETNLSNYCSTLKSAGFTVLVATLQQVPNNDANRLALNTYIRANYTTFANVLVDLAAAPQLSNNTDLTYFEADQLHLNDAGQAVAAALFQTALASV